jgi:hypothetical protein
MPFEVRHSQPTPTVRLPCTDPTTGSAGTAMIFAGTALVGPQAGGGVHMYMSGVTAPGETVGFYVPGARPFSSGEGVAAWAEVSLAQLVLNVSGQALHAHGVSNPSVQLVQGDGGLWPYLTFVCHGGHDIVVSYRVTLVSPSS